MNAKVEEVDLRAAVESGQIPNEGTIIEGESTAIEQDWSDAEAAEAELMGWIPPDRAKKLPEGKSFVGPKEFMERNPLYKKMKSLESTVGQLNSHHQRVLENEQKKAEKHYKDELERLKAEKITALDEGDNKRVVEIDEEIRTTEKPEATPESDPVFDNWSKDNAWYAEDKFLAVQADQIAQKYLSEGVFGQEMLEKMTNDIKSGFPDKFETKTRPATVESDTRGVNRSSSKTLSEKDLTLDEREVFKNFDRMGVFADDKAKAKYLKEVIDLRD